MMAVRIFAIVGFLAIGCGGSTTDQAVVKTAASRWKCPASDIEIKKLSADMYRVAGCEHEADYACSDQETQSGGGCVRLSGT